MTAITASINFVVAPFAGVTAAWKRFVSSEPMPTWTEYLCDCHKDGAKDAK